MIALTRDEVVESRDVPHQPVTLLPVPRPDVSAECEDLPLLTLWRFFRGWGDQNAMKLASGALAALRAQGCVVLCPASVTSPYLGCLQVVAAVAQVLGEDREELVGERRTHPLVQHRQVAMAVCRRATKASLPTIGRAFNRDHSTVSSNIRRAEEIPELRAEVERIAGLLVEADGHA